MNLAGLSFRDIEYLVAVADHLHFGKAATACAVSQPTLSAQVRKLEDYLGVQVFERASRSVMITDRGVEVIAQSRAVLAEGRRLLEMAQSRAEPLGGQFRLGVISTLAPYVAPIILNPLRERFPKLRLHLVDGMAHSLVRALEAGELDALLASSPIRGIELSELPVFHESFVLAVPRDHRLAVIERVTLEDVPADELILLSDGHCLRDQTIALFSGQRATQGGGAMQATSLETLRQMIGAGIGLSLLPQLAVQVGTLLDDMVAYRLIRAPALPGRDISLFHRPSFGRIREVRLLRDVIRDALAGLGTIRVHGHPQTRALGAG
ncbi:LysR substrate-binding domain-containing protein [Roseomonas populi]|uniref:LysR substrate-binding domain-containing protein n=1 Tax=Roseomonas populi TaxID=3121582 RepID=A0ABT1X2I2_9PROT|nr:LysR substrate-binding domain-containing protein [Roseomonas pecuniae]MCR0982316.1 LysR substrate-binding domain-containing protein [Roseomonas pecuniae]